MCSKSNRKSQKLSVLYKMMENLLNGSNPLKHEYSMIRVSATDKLTVLDTVNVLKSQTLYSTQFLLKFCFLYTWAQLFKANNVVS